MKRFAFVTIVAVCTGFFLSHQAHATTIDPLLPEELILGAAFVGVVECETAGGIVARYRVVESWKGPKPGSIIAVYDPPDFWSHQFPIALCGERYYMTAFKQAPSTLITKSGGPSPLWWRKIPFDYDLPLFQGRELLPADPAANKKVQDTLKLAKHLLSLKPAEQEAALLRAVVEVHLLGKKWRGGEEDPNKLKGLKKKFADLTSAEGLVAELLRLAKEDKEKWAIRTNIVFRQGGMAVALGALEKLGPDTSPWDQEDLSWSVRSIRHRLGLLKVEQGNSEDAGGGIKAPPKEQLEMLHQSLRAGTKDRNFGEAFTVLSKHDPKAVADFLVNWQPKVEKEGLPSLLDSYTLASFFALQCGKDREKHFKTMLTAKDPWVRVAGAVYLCFENKELGIEELKKCMALKNDAGAWAALALARRGQKDAVIRALKVFEDQDKEGETKLDGLAQMLRGNLQDQMLVLLSNSAHAAKLPPITRPESRAGSYQKLRQWWDQNEVQLKLVDPWAAVLDKQKID